MNESIASQSLPQSVLDTIDTEVRDDAERISASDRAAGASDSVVGVESESAGAASPQPKPYLTIRASSGWAPLDLREVWQFRDLMFTLAGRDLKVRYKQTALGVAWVILQPLLGAGVFTFIFGTVAKLPSDGVPYFIFSYAGLLGWNLFSTTVNKVSGAMTGNAHLITKVYFPRLVLPLATILSTLFDFAVALGLLAVVLAAHHIWPGAPLLTLPIWMFLLLALGMGIGLLAAAFMVHYRDVGHVLGLVMQLLMYVTPVAYAFSAVPPKLRTLYQLNPLSPLMEALRWSLLGQGEMPWGFIGYASLMSIGALLAGTITFKRMERKFVDTI